MSNRKPLDISQLYDELKKLGGTYSFGVDIVQFGAINETYGYAAGDIVIAEAFHRLERELSEDMLLFRTGGDEFAVVTRFHDLADAEALAHRIAAHNGATVKTAEHEIALSLRLGISQIPCETLNYQDALAILYSAVDEARRTDGGVAVYITPGS